MSETGTIAAVLGTDLIPAVVAFKEGYEGWRSLHQPRHRSHLHLPPRWSGCCLHRPEWGATTTAQAISNGADVVFGAGGKTGNGAITEAAGYEGVYCIGVDSDQWGTVPKHSPA